MVSGSRADHRPHNLLVPGSSPGCPTFSTNGSEQVFEHYANVAKTAFYAIFTQSVTTDQHNSKQHLFLSISFSEIFSYFPIFSWEQWVFWEHNSFPFHFHVLTVHLSVPIPINRSWDRWERRKILFIGKSRSNHAKNSQIFLELRNKCVKFTYLVSHICLQADILIDIRRILYPLFWFFAICAIVLYFILEVIWERSAR
jgi:hypothetical protein